MTNNFATVWSTMIIEDTGWSIADGISSEEIKLVHAIVVGGYNGPYAFGAIVHKNGSYIGEFRAPFKLECGEITPEAKSLITIDRDIAEGAIKSLEDYGIWDSPCISDMSNVRGGNGYYHFSYRQSERNSFCVPAFALQSNQALTDIVLVYDQLFFNNSFKPLIDWGRERKERAGSTCRPPHRGPQPKQDPNPSTDDPTDP